MKRRFCMEKNHCVSKLYKLIKELNNSTPKEQLAQLFEVDINDTAAILNAYASLYTLCNDSRKYILEKQPNNIVVLEYIDDIIMGLNKMDLDASYGSRYFSSETISGLKIIASMLPESHNTLSNEQIDDIRNNLNNLLNSVSSSTINEELRILLIKHITEMLNYINKYHLLNSDEFIGSLEKCAGSIWLNRPLVNTNEEKNICKKILEFTINSISFFNTHLPLIEYVEKFLS